MRLAIVIFALVGLAVSPILIFGDTIDEQFGGEKGVELLEACGHWAWMVGIGLIVGDLVLPVPTPAVLATLGLMYGVLLGGIIGGIGSCLAGLVGYVGCRLIGQRAATFLVGEDTLAGLRRFFDKYGGAAIAFSRWLPILPEGLTCLAGLSRMPFRSFMPPLALGSFAMSFAFAGLGSAYQDRPALGILLSAAIPLALWPVIHRALKRSKPAAAPAPIMVPDHAA